MGDLPPNHIPTPPVLDRYVRALITSKAQELIRRRRFKRHQKPDVIQEMTAAVIQAAPKFDSSRGAAMPTFCDRVATNHARSLIRQQRTARSGAGIVIESLHDLPHEMQGRSRLGICVQDIPDQVTSRQTASAVAEAIAQLPPRLASIAEGLKQDRPAELARRLGLSRQCIRCAMDQLRTRFLAAGLQPE